MKKVMICGLSGAGKSVLAQRLGEAYSLPVRHLDRYYWQPGWKEIHPHAFREIHEALIAQNEWILEGNSMVTFNERVNAADTIIYLDLPRIACLWRVVKRRFFYAQKDRAHRPSGCKETISWHLVRYVLWRFHKKYRPAVLDCLEQARKEGKNVRIVTSFKEVEQFVSQKN